MFSKKKVHQLDGKECNKFDRHEAEEALCFIASLCPQNMYIHEICTFSCCTCVKPSKCCEKQSTKATLVKISRLNMTKIYIIHIIDKFILLINREN